MRFKEETLCIKTPNSTAGVDSHHHYYSTPKNDTYQPESEKEALEFPKFLAINRRRPIPQETEYTFRNNHHIKRISALKPIGFCLKPNNSELLGNAKDNIEFPDDLLLPDLSSSRTNE